MIKLGHPLGWDQSYENDNAKQQEFIKKINIPMDR